MEPIGIGGISLRFCFSQSRHTQSEPSASHIVPMGVGVMARPGEASEVPGVALCGVISTVQGFGVSKAQGGGGMGVAKTSGRL